LGDIVPGINYIKKGDISTAGRNLFIAIAYIFLGMAILAMCYDLMQEQMVEKVKAIALRLGIISETDENGDEILPKNELEDRDNMEDIEKEPFESRRTPVSREATRIQVKSRNSDDFEYDASRDNHGYLEEEDEPPTRIHGGGTNHKEKSYAGSSVDREESELSFRDASHRESSNLIKGKSNLSEREPSVLLFKEPIGLH
jgi:hypothetical protein